VLRANLVIITSFSLAFALLGLFSCDIRQDAKTICKNNPELCEDLHKDSWCRVERSRLVHGRLAIKKSPSPTGEQLYQQLTYLEDYSRCIELAAGVKHILHPQRTNERMRAFGLSTQNLAELQESTRGNTDLHLSYYHWSRFNDDKALERLLLAESRNAIVDPVLLSHIATYYLKSDAAKAKALYLRVLVLADASQFDTDWLFGLASASRQMQDMEQAYLFSKANVILTKQPVSNDQMLAMIGGNMVLARQLDREAETLADALDSGNYANSKIRIKLETGVKR
jgi:hypothetical protein